VTWREFIDKVNGVIDALGVAHDAVDIRYIDVLGSEGINAVEVLRKDEGRYEMFVE
jgi:hypothetical protein